MKKRGVQNNTTKTAFKVFITLNAVFSLYLCNQETALSADSDFWQVVQRLVYFFLRVLIINKFSGKIIVVCGKVEVAVP